MIDRSQVPDVNGLSADSLRGSEHHIRIDLVQPAHVRLVDDDPNRRLEREELTFHERTALERVGQLQSGVIDRLDDMDKRSGTFDQGKVDAREEPRREFGGKPDPLATDRTSFLAASPTTRVSDPVPFVPSNRFHDANQPPAPFGSSPETVNVTEASATDTDATNVVDDDDAACYLCQVPKRHHGDIKHEFADVEPHCRVCNVPRSYHAGLDSDHTFNGPNGPDQETNPAPIM